MQFVWWAVIWHQIKMWSSASLAIYSLFKCSKCFNTTQKWWFVISWSFFSLTKFPWNIYGIWKNNMLLKLTQIIATFWKPLVGPTDLCDNSCALNILVKFFIRTKSDSYRTMTLIFLTQFSKCSAQRIVSQWFNGKFYCYVMQMS